MPRRGSDACAQATERASGQSVRATNRRAHKRQTEAEYLRLHPRARARATAANARARFLPLSRRRRRPPSLSSAARHRFRFYTSARVDQKFASKSARALRCATFVEIASDARLRYFVAKRRRLADRGGAINKTKIIIMRSARRSARARKSCAKIALRSGDLRAVDLFGRAAGKTASGHSRAQTTASARCR